MQDYMADATGNFVGIGIYMVKNTEKNLVQVLSPIRESPAEKVGIKAVIVMSGFVLIYLERY